MSLFGLMRTFKGLRRSRVILGTFTAYGFGHLVSRAQGGARLLPRFRRRRVPPPAGLDVHEDAARRLRQAFEELGPTFVKFGQVLSGRPDLIPEPYLSQFKVLQDRVAPFPSAEAKAVVEKALGGPLEKFFRTFDAEPIASGSIAQAHTAIALDGHPVVVKVKRPGIDKTIMTDLFLLENLARMIRRHIPESEAFQPEVLVEEFAVNIKRELDFITEASTTQQFGALMTKCTGLRTPKVYWKLTTPDVLTLEKIEGENIQNSTLLKNPEIDRKELARRLAKIFFRQYFTTGIFHADPHPGNILICPNGDLALIDFGMVGRLTPDVQRNLGDLLQAVYARDLEGAVVLATELGSTGHDTDVGQLTSDLAAVLDKYFGMPLKYIDHKRLFQELTSAANRNHLKLPRNLLMLGKSLVTLLTTIEWLDPEFDLAGSAAPYVRAAFMRQFNPKRVISGMRDVTVQLRRLATEAPHTLRKLMKSAARGDMQIQFKHTGLENLLLDFDRSTNRMSLAVITAAIIVGSSLVTMNERTQIFGLIGFFAASVLGIVLIVGIIKSGKI